MFLNIFASRKIFDIVIKFCEMLEYWLVCTVNKMLLFYLTKASKNNYIFDIEAFDIL